MEKINNIFVNVEINREYFKNVEKRNFIFADKLHTMMLHRGDDARTLEDKIFVQINLNAVDKYDSNKKKLKYGTDKIVYYGLDTGIIYNSNNYSYVKYLEYYRDMYYNDGEVLDEAGLWLVLLTSKSFLELYNILGKLFDDDKRERFIRDVIDMNDDRVIFQDWEIKKLNELVKYTSEKNMKEEATREGLEKGMKLGIEQGIEQGKNQLLNEHIEAMLNEGIDVEIISRITGKTDEDIMLIKENLDNKQ